MPPTLDDYCWLISPAAATILRETQLLCAKEEPITLLTKLRKSLSIERSHLIMQQCELRTRAWIKFSDSDQMFFTEIGLQQASGEAVAEHKAARFPAETLVFDLCCGIGGDLLSLAARGPVVGVERDELTALFAAANCKAMGAAHAEVQCQDVTSLHFDESSMVHIDPDRRPSGRRTTRLGLHEPSDELLFSLVDCCAGGAIKLAPACDVPAAWRERCELEWISYLGECKQLVVWFGALAGRSGVRSATLIPVRGEPRAIASHDDAEAAAIASAIGRFVYEPDSAVIAARLVDALAARHQLSRIAAHVAYLTGDARIDDPLVAGFEVADVMPFDVKRVKAALRAGGYGRLTIKKRGVDASPEELQRILQVDGDNQVTLLLTLQGGKIVAIIAQRLPAA